MFIAGKLQRQNVHMDIGHRLGAPVSETEAPQLRWGPRLCLTSLPHDSAVCSRGREPECRRPTENAQIFLLGMFITVISNRKTVAKGEIHVTNPVGKGEHSADMRKS